MSAKEYAVRLLSTLSEEQMIEFVRLFADENTIARMESDLVAQDPNAKTYSSFDEFLLEMEQEADE